MLYPLYLTTPTACSLELTFECNNCCKGCANHPNIYIRQPSEIIQSASWEKILDAIPGLQLLKITGGEPTLHPEFYTIITEIERRGIPFTLFTNARWRDPSQLIAFLTHISCCEGLLISLHGATAKTHEKFTAVPGSFVETVENVKKATQSGIFVAISCVVTEHNVHELDAIVSLAHSIGSQAVIFNRYLPPRSEVTESATALREAIGIVETLRHNSEIAVRWGDCIPQCFAFSSSTGCHAGITHFTIDPKGNVRPCNHAPLICGNILEQSIEEIWQGSKMSYWRSLVPEPCYQCAMVELCHGGCRALQMITGKSTDPFMKGPLAPEDVSFEDEVIELPALARPKLCGTIHQEPFGLALTHRGRFVPFAVEGRPFLNVLDGSITLEHLEQQYGNEALSFVAFLLKRDLVQLVE